jgi:hypothetical protein
MRIQLFLKIKKAVLLGIRKATKSFANKHRIAAAIYYWSDFAIFKIKGVYVLPVFFYRFMTWFLNGIASANTVDINTLRSRRLQLVVKWMIHLIPDEIRFA